VLWSGALVLAGGICAWAKAMAGSAIAATALAAKRLNGFIFLSSSNPPL
jgi:hypothetical protein